MISNYHINRVVEVPSQPGFADHARYAMKAPPIFAPTFRGDVATVRALLDATPTLIAARNAKNLTPLHVAASRGQAETVQVLLDYGADIQGSPEKGE